MGVFRSSPWRAAAGLLVAVAAVFSVTIGTVSASGHDSSQSQACTINSPCIHAANQGDVDRGTTPGWLNGRTVSFLYTKNFYCASPPSSAAQGFCEVGAQARFAPVTGQVDPLYVVTPIGFTPAADTLHCPVAGNCVDHPHNIDLSRVFGSSTSDALLPPHSHIVTTSNNQRAEWWRIFVIGVTSQSAWNGIVDGKSFSAAHACIDAGSCTKPIASNLFLFFAVKNAS